MRNPTCDFCREFTAVDYLLEFACPVCDRRMVQLLGDGLSGVVLHCPDHCTTLMPNRALLAAARTARR